MNRILVIKTAALGDVLRTTSILPGLRARDPQAEIVWVTAVEARDLVAHHPLVDRVETVRLGDADSVRALGVRLAAQRWDLVLSFEEDRLLCGLASSIGGEHLIGGHLDDGGLPTYTPDVEPWFGMGLIARDGRQAADARKRANRRTHPEIFASMLGVQPGRPELPLPAMRCALARTRLAVGGRPRIALNTGAGSRWPTKALPVERVVELVDRLAAVLAAEPTFVLLGGPSERERNALIVAGVRALPTRPRLVDTGCDNELLDFAALIDASDVLVTSDSLGMHIAIARQVPTVAFFAPTSAAEIELFGLGEKIASTAPDYCSYRRDADNSTITAELVADAVVRVLRTVRRPLGDAPPAEPGVVESPLGERPGDAH
ncbi:MAG: glycosyltransferase family 9 protein [Planctomycetes bacterium]|nr:glycosyltransferase family 9 protein [Planctomycetota bacterium]